MSFKRLFYRCFFLLCCFNALACSKKMDVTSGGGPVKTIPVAPLKSDVTEWLTTSDHTILLKKQNTALVFKDSSNADPSLTIDTSTVYQSIDGFGFALTGGSASVIDALPPTKRDSILNELFGTDSSSIGISYLRISIGASDLSASLFTYDEVNGSDSSLQSFSIAPEMTDLVPILKKILAINPSIKILGSPWTAPTWMKTNKSFSAGSLNTANYATYAQYFVKYIQAMQAQGITIDAITPQNEPLNANNNPSMLMQPQEEDNFVKNDLGPAFQAAGIKTKIIVYDHNADRPDYPETILADAAAAAFVDGSAFHLYAGDISALSGVHSEYPNKNLYFTEIYTASTGSFAGDLSWHLTNVIIGATRNWSRNVLEWNLATDANFGPHTDGGCSTCQGALTISSFISRNVSYYIVAHASKFVKPGAVRISSSLPAQLPNVAFKNLDGSKVLIVLNSASSIQKFNLTFNGKIVSCGLTSGSVATYTWK